MPKLKGREILFMLLPVMVFAAIGLGLGADEAAPVVEKVEVAPYPPGSFGGGSGKTVNGKLLLFRTDTQIRVYIRYRAPHFYTRMWGWKTGEALSWETEKTSIYAESGRALETAVGWGGLEYRGNNLFCIEYEYASAEIPRSAEKVTFKMTGKATDSKDRSWVLSASTIVPSQTNPPLVLPF